ncbi:MAG TPA: hypothetical protein VJ596_03405 [Gemmatimonadaceae bacterium]|nr:hypothetical protein [Gemmatimonadaceae bacterium]
MMAYVFWHWKRPTVSEVEYERLQREFHGALMAAPSTGFARSFSVALTGAPWANRREDAYEDWYLVRDSAALDPLNDAAVTASRRAPHDAAAAAAAGGTAGLYRVRLGETLTVPSLAYWFAKPDGMSYDRLWELCSPLVREGRGALWIRHMVLGPSPEFCLHAVAETPLPAGISSLRLVLRPIWAGGHDT